MIDVKLMDLAMDSIREARAAADRGDWVEASRGLEQASRRCVQVVSEIAVAAVRGAIRKVSA